MTTKVTIEAHACWPVDVSFIGQTSAQSVERVLPHEKRDFYVHSGQDILVHEVQPDTDGGAKRDGLDFGSALRMLRAGARVARKGWNGKDMWLALSSGDYGTAREIDADKFWSRHNRAFAEANGGKATVLPCITMKTASGEILMGWLASQTDMLTDDWFIVS
jgi:hypothetical protein